MTSKEEYAAIIDKLCNKMLCGGECLVGEGKCELLETIREAIIKAVKYDELNQNLTLSECIKEWNEKGFDVDVYALEIVIHNYSTVDKEEDEIEISIRLDKKTIFYVNDVELSFDLHHLLSKTIKALEGMKDE